MDVQPLITVSVVSHRQGRLLAGLLEDIQDQCPDLVEVLVTLNVVESFELGPARYSFPIRVVRNERERGFGANHNAAFKRRHGSYFCVMNPDVRICSNPFPALLECFKDRDVGCAGPMVLDPAGGIEKSVRRFPTPASLMLKVLGREPSGVDQGGGESRLFADWVAGMMMLFPEEAYEAVRGFDESYHLYYEDVDICARLWTGGYKVAFCPRARVVHDARRHSHRNLRYLTWHLASMLRFFGRSVTRQYGRGRGGGR